MRRRPIPSIARAAAVMAVALALVPMPASGQSSSPPPPSVGAVSGTGAATPEAAVTAYLAAVAANDVDAILGASAVDAMASGFDFQAYAERLQVITPVQGLAPAEYPMYAGMNRYQQAAQILGQVRNLAYGLLSGETIDGTVIGPVEEAQIEAFLTAVDPSALARLSVLDIRPPEPDLAAGDRYIEMTTRLAETYGADELTERLALIELDGETFGLGFTMLRYGDAWLVSMQSSALGGTPPLGTAEPMSRAEYDDRTS